MRGYFNKGEKMTDLLGILGPGLLAICGVFEVIPSIKRGYCGSSLPYLLAWFFGEVFALVYIIFTSMDNYLLLNYSLNSILIIVLLYYKTKTPKPEPIRTISFEGTKCIK